MVTSSKPIAGPPSGINAADRPGTLVVIGDSADGIAAVRQLFKGLSPDSDIAFLYIRHAGPGSRGMPEVVLSKAAAVKVVQVRRTVPIRSGNIYICPAGKDIIVQHGELRLSPMHSRSGTHFPIDRLFVSVAENCGKDAIGILLSGNSPDGIAGLTAIKRSGGTTFAQDGTARSQVIPKAAIAKGIVDYVLSPEKIAVELNRITEGRTFPKPTASGGEPKMPADDGARDERSRLRNGPIERITGFFPYREAMTYLKKAIFPRILEIKKGCDPIRIWIPACSTGEEAYSIAIILAEVLAESLPCTRVQIFATDLSEKLLAKARSGTYSQAEVAGVSPGRLQRFFTRTDDGYRIIKPVRDMCIFARHDVFKDPPFCRIHLISCSSLLTCLEDISKEKVLATFHFALNPGGYLMLGGAETMRGSVGLFTHSYKRLKVYTKIRNTSSRDLLEMNYRLPSPGERGRDERSLEQVVDTILLKEYMPPGVVINKNLEILQFRGSTRLFLEPASCKTSLNLLRIVRPDLEFVLENAILRVVRSRERYQMDGIRIKLDGRTVDISIEVIPLPDGPAGQLLLVIFREIMATPIRSSLTNCIKDKKIRELENELLATRSDMRSIIEEQKEVNEDLQAANEELLSLNEELQSANEELRAVRGAFGTRAPVFRKNS